ncbi:MAG: hypothetical protein ACO1SV_20520 [Fimbriimonas sp.]
MLTTFIAGLATMAPSQFPGQAPTSVSQAPTTNAPAVEARITGVSMFKNGYAMVVREMRIPAAGEHVWEQIPQASLGTLWIAADEASALETVGTVRVLRDTTRPLASLHELLVANVGKQVQLGIANDDPVTTRIVTGKLVSAGAIVVIENAKGSLAFPSGVVTSVGTNDGPMVTTGKSQTEREGLRVRTRGAGRVSIFTLEKGFSWAPNYSLELGEGGRLTLSGKATMFNEVQDLTGSDVRFVTGFPNVPYAFVPDPLTGASNLEDFLALIRGVAPASAMQAGFDGGHGGGGGRAGEIRAVRPSGTLAIPEFDGKESDDLFFYPLANVSVRRGERSYHSLFRSKDVPYQDVYTWNVANVRGDQGAPDGVVRGDDVWHTLRFKNEGKDAQPLSTGAVTMFRNGQLLGQDLFTYTPVGGEIVLRLNKALDVIASAEEVEIGREKAPSEPRDQPRFDRTLVRGRLDIVNQRAHPVTMRITRTVQGDVVKTEERPQLTKLPAHPSAINVPNTLEWTLTVPAKQRKQVVYEYKVLSRAG